MHTQQIKIRWAYVGIFWSIVSCLTFLFSVLLRQGLQTPLLLTASALGIALTVFNAPFIFPEKFGVHYWNSSWRITLLCVMFLLYPLCALALGPISIWILIPLGLYGFWKAWWTIDWRIGVWKILIKIFTGLLIACLLAIYIVTCGNWLFTAEIAKAGLLLPDVYYHFSVTEMFRVHDSISLGVHGLAPLKYHFGSHLWFAALSTLAEHGTEYAYSLGMTIVLIPALFFAVCISAASFSAVIDFSQTKFIYGMVFVVGSTILLDKIGLHSYYVSPSHTISLILLMLALPMLTADLNAHGATYFSILLAFIFLLSITKVSAGMLWGGACCYLFLRSELALWRRASLIFVTVIITGLCVKMSISPAQQTVERSLSFSLFHFYRIYGNLFTLSSLVPPAILAIIAFALRFRWRQTVTSPGQLKLLRGAEISLFISGISMIPGALIPIAGGGAWYFINVAQWVCLTSLGALLLSIEGRAAGIDSLRKYVAGLFVVCTLSAFFSMARQNYAESLQFLRQLPGTPAKDLSVSAIDFAINSFRQNGRLIPVDFESRIIALPVNQLITQLRAEKKSDFLVFIPPEANWFWKTSGDCMSKTFLIPAMTGHPLLYGLPPNKSCATDYYDQSVLGMRSRPWNKIKMCREARRLGFRAIARVDASQSNEQLTLLNCTF
jgi:hypothetical protein